MGCYINCRYSKGSWLLGGCVLLVLFGLRVTDQMVREGIVLAHSWQANFSNPTRT